MKVLFLDGAPGHTTFIPLHVSKDHECSPFDVTSPELMTMYQKYGTWSDIPLEDIDIPVMATLGKLEDRILSEQPDAIIATNFACTLVSSLILDCTWSGKTVMINPQGQTLDTGECDDIQRDFDCTWILTADSDVCGIEGMPHYENCIQVLLPTLDVDVICETGILSGILSVHRQDMCYY